MSGDACLLRLEGELGIYRAAELKQQLLAPEVEVLDLQAVTAIDSAGVQLLLLAKRTAQEEGRALRVGAAGPAVRAALALLGLEARLDLAPQAEVAA